MFSKRLLVDSKDNPQETVNPARAGGGECFGLGTDLWKLVHRTEFENTNEHVCIIALRGRSALLRCVLFQNVSEYICQSTKTKFNIGSGAFAIYCTIQYIIKLLYNYISKSRQSIIISLLLSSLYSLIHS